jgi:chromate transporter
MTYVLLIFEFFKIGLLAIGGGLVTVPFLFDLAEKYDWFTKTELANMIAISESTPGPIGVNMATFAGFSAEGILGGIIATFALVTPSVIIMILVAKMMKKYSCNVRVKDVLSGIRPAVLALILFAGLELGKIVIVEVKDILFLAVVFTMMRIWKKSPIYYLCLSGVLGILLKTL